MKVTKLTKLPAYLRDLRKDVDNLYKLVENLNSKQLATQEGVTKSNARADELRDNIDSLSQEVESLLLRNAELEHMVAAAKSSTSSTARKAGAPSSAELFAQNHDLDAFYLEFENRFRGTEKEIQDKQAPYIKLFKASAADKKLPVVDLGCGRGEFLDLLTKNDLKAIGVDLNESMVQRAKKKGFEAIEDDAIGYLMKQKSGTLAGVTGFHLAEHIPFEQLLLLIAEAYRCLAKGGILLLETPNPESLFVGAFTFHYDPSHLKPLPPAIVQFSAKFKGFERADIMRMQPELTEEEIVKATSNGRLQDALRRLYGARDYALVAYK